jgi:hypothetical protein
VTNTKEKQFKRVKIYFDSCFHCTISFFLCCETEERLNLVVIRVLSTTKLFTLWPSGSREQDGTGPGTRYASKDVPLVTYCPQPGPTSYYLSKMPSNYDSVNGLTH